MTILYRKFRAQFALAAVLHTMLLSQGAMFRAALSGQLPAVPMARSEGSHQCPCTRNGGECHCAGDCCGLPGKDGPGYCAQSGPQSAPDPPRVVPIPLTRDYLPHSLNFPHHLSLHLLQALARQYHATDWCSSPDTPPPRWS